MHAADPIIFRGLKSLTLADTQQQSLLRLALEGISVYGDPPNGSDSLRILIPASRSTALTPPSTPRREVWAIGWPTS